MATANIDLPNGAKVHVEGTAEDINKVLAVCGALSVDGTKKGERSTPLHKINHDGGTSRRAARGVMQYIRDLIRESFFREKRSISDVQQKLEELGHIYPLTHLSTPLQRLVRNRELRRMRDGKNWVYVNE